MACALDWSSHISERLYSWDLKEHIVMSKKVIASFNKMVLCSLMAAALGDRFLPQQLSL